MRQLDIHVVGFDKATDQVIRGLRQHFGLPRDAAERFVKSVPRVARHCVDATEARAYERTLRSIGAVVELRRAESLAPRAAMDVPSLPTPHSATSDRPQYDSSAKLAAKIPRAPGVPAEATRKPAPGAADEFGNPLDAPGHLVMTPAALAKAKREQDATPGMPLKIERRLPTPTGAHEAQTPVVNDDPGARDADATDSLQSSAEASESTLAIPSSRLWIGLAIVAAVAVSLWQLTH